MGEMFVDTSGWASWADRTQLHHTQAVDALDSLWQGGGIALTTNWILVELTALMTSPLRIPKSEQIRFLDDLLADPAVVVLPIDASLEASAWALWKSRPDKLWSLADCASFVVMRHRRLTEALTADHHYEQAGFVRLLK
jgi:predicted nucleic acid-binding protein